MPLEKIQKPIKNSKCHSHQREVETASPNLRPKSFAKLVLGLKQGSGKVPMIVMSVQSGEFERINKWENGKLLVKYW